MIYKKGTSLINVHSGHIYTVIEDQGEGSIYVMLDEHNIYVAWDAVRKLTKLEKALA